MINCDSLAGLDTRSTVMAAGYVENGAGDTVDNESGPNLGDGGDSNNADIVLGVSRTQDGVFA